MWGKDMDAKEELKLENKKTKDRGMNKKNQAMTAHEKKVWRQDFDSIRIRSNHNGSRPGILIQDGGMIFCLHLLMQGQVGCHQTTI